MADVTQVQALSRVLVADDEHLVATGIVQHLHTLNFDPIGPAVDGNAAIELARKEKPDLALLDIKMPGMDGLDCAAALWSELQLPCVIISAYSISDYVERACEPGVFGYLLKPVSTDSLRAALHVAWTRAMSQIETNGRVTQLEQTLASRRVVEQAKWRIVETLGTTEDAAHRALQKSARSQRLRLSDVAQRIIDTSADLWHLDIAESKAS